MVAGDDLCAPMLPQPKAVCRPQPCAASEAGEQVMRVDAPPSGGIGACNPSPCLEAARTALAVATDPT